MARPAPAVLAPSLAEFQAERARREMRQAERASRAADFARWYRAPLEWARDCVIFPPGLALAPYQAEQLEHLGLDRRVSARGPHGIGKSTVAALSLLWFATTREGQSWKVVTTASVWRQLEQYLWPEVHKWARRLRWERLGRAPFVLGQELLTLALKLGGGAATAVASDDPALIEGAHADSILYIFDEAKAIPPGTFDAAEGALMSGEAYALMLSTPGPPAGRFFEVQSRKPGFEDWWVRHVRLEEGVTAYAESRGLYGVDPARAEQRKRQWGEASAVYRNRVLGEFADDATDGIIPLAWIEAANDRWREWQARTGGVVEGPLTSVGVDVSDGGDDVTVLAPRQGDLIVELRRYTAAAGETMTVVGHVSGILQAHGGRAIVDGIGIGSGVVSRLRELHQDISSFVASEGTEVLDRTGELGFVNLRTAAWWGLRERLDPAFGSTLALPPDDRLTGDLVSPRWRALSGGKIQLESKDDIRKRIGRSTDDGDAVVMAFADRLVAPPPDPNKRLVW